MPFWDGAPVWLQPAVLAGFVAAFFVRWRMDPEPAAWMRRNWWDLLLVVVLASPALRALALLRMAGALLALRSVIVERRAHDWGLRMLLWSADAWPAAIAVGLGVIFVFGTVEFLIEHGRNPSFARFEDGLWWALATVTTVGYGDVTPTTGAGRIVAAIAMVFGIAAYSLLVANLTVHLERLLERERRRLGSRKRDERE